MPTKNATLRVPAISFQQNTNRQLFTFVVDGKQLDRFCSVSRLSRPQSKKLLGYQRPEVVSHIAQIRDYLESASAMLPNSIVVAFNTAIQFTPIGSNSENSNAGFGWLEIPVKDCDGNPIIAGSIVDGQQRAAALKQAIISEFPISVVAFIARDIDDQREQFILVNAVKPLPRGLLIELLPETNSKLPLRLENTRAAATILTQLNTAPDSPFYRLIRTPTCVSGVIADASILKMIRNSLIDGALYELQNKAEQLQLIIAYWHAVRTVFPAAWGIKPQKSRLMHGSGIVAMGLIMDSAATLLSRSREPLSTSNFEREVRKLESFCNWTSGTWIFHDGSMVPWSQLQNTPSHVQMLCRHVTTLYRSKR